jgi:regulator of replication initiation timing
MHLSCVQSIQATITIIKDFASQFTLLQAETTRLQQDVQSSSAQLDQAIRIATTARQEADSLKKELGQMMKKLKEEEKAKAEAQAQAKEKEDLLRSSITALLGNFIVVSSIIFFAYLY